MINLDKMHENIFLCSSHGERISILRDDVIELITSLREADMNAARYRWLRDEAKANYLDLMVHLESIEWDDAVDQAMKEKGDE